MNIVLVISFSVITFHNINLVMSSFCNKSNHWCQKSGFRIKYLDLRFIQLNQSEYKSCIHYCTENVICKAFEYDVDKQRCRFASFLSGNVDQHDSNEIEVYWKKTHNESCSQEIHEGN